MNCPRIKRGILRLWVNCWKEQSTFLVRCERIFYDLETARSSGATHVPSQPSAISSSRTKPCCDSGLPHDTRNIVGTSGYVFERPSPRGGRTSTFFNNSKNLASSSLKLGLDSEGNARRSEKEVRREPQKSSIPVPRFQRRAGVCDHTGGTYSHNGMIDDPRFPISELHLVKFLDSMEFQSWKVNFKTEACSKTADPHLAMHWIKKGWDSKVNWRTCDIAIDCGAKRFSPLRYAWCDDCVCTEKTSRQTCSLPQKSKCRRSACSKIRPILTRKTNCLHDLRAFPCNRSLWSGTKTPRFIQYTFAERRCPRFRRSIGSSSCIS